MVLTSLVTGIELTKSEFGQKLSYDRAMRRIVEPKRIIFVDRNLGWSLLLCGSSIGALVMAAAAYERKEDPTSGSLIFFATVGAGALFLAALWMLFRKRAFIIEQRFMSRNFFSYPLERVSVKLEQKVLRPYRNRGGGRSNDVLIVGAIWLMIEGHNDVPFLEDLRGPEEGKMLATQLAADLESPIHVIERNDWTE